MILNENSHSAFLSQIERKSFKEAKKDEASIIAMQEDLHQFKKYKVWTHVSCPKDHPIIRTEWIFKNKLDEHGWRHKK